MLHYKHLFDQLYSDYSRLNPSVKKINELFKDSGETIINDHIALRTFNIPEINLDSIAKPFLEGGYKEKGFYCFNEKKLTAKHFEHVKDPLAPKVFISQLIIEDLPQAYQDIIQKEIIDNINQIPTSHKLLLAGRLWNLPKYEIYKELLKTSEYAAWLYVFGIRANHFTILINHLSHFTGIKMVNEFLKNKGFTLNTAGGEIKGSPAAYLEQSSTLADIVKIQFEEGDFMIPACYYEFAMRYVLPSGELFSGFQTTSADKIFESTNNQINT
ncbi:DUF1338 domain-containing protein [Carboxylicivirga marina]|uniref:DUF1338 domain-containing protein n=1 Tax=Carboxylicivirga marina TaxID=2800988 RepID=UPI0025989D4D|nr:DUF1338 domain-containing protein [uncultured Carboxylicivirga sp.]